MNICPCIKQFVWKKIFFGYCGVRYQKLSFNYIAGLIYKKVIEASTVLEKMLENRKSALDKSKSAFVFYMDFSKAFDTISHDLLLAKFKFCGFSKDADFDV